MKTPLSGSGAPILRKEKGEYLTRSTFMWDGFARGNGISQTGGARIGIPTILAGLSRY